MDIFEISLFSILCVLLIVSYITDDYGESCQEGEACAAGLECDTDTDKCECVGETHWEESLTQCIHDNSKNYLGSS